MVACKDCTLLTILQLNGWEKMAIKALTRQTIQSMFNTYKCKSTKIHKTLPDNFSIKFLIVININSCLSHTYVVQQLQTDQDHSPLNAVLALGAQHSVDQSTLLVACGLVVDYTVLRPHMTKFFLH